MTDTETTTAASDPRAGRQVRKTVRNIQRFAQAHGGGDAVVEYIGRGATRIVLVGGDGAWGDQVVRSPEAARAAVEQSGMTLHEEFPADVAARVRTSDYEWGRMAGIQLGGGGR